MNENSAQDVQAEIDRIIGPDPNTRVVMFIMPRDVGPGPHTPRGHSAVWSRAAVVAEWRDGGFQIVKGQHPALRRPGFWARIRDHLDRYSYNG